MGGDCCWSEGPTTTTITSRPQVKTAPGSGDYNSTQGQPSSRNELPRDFTSHTSTSTGCIITLTAFAIAAWSRRRRSSSSSSRTTACQFQHVHMSVRQCSSSGSRRRSSGGSSGSSGGGAGAIKSDYLQSALPDSTPNPRRIELSLHHCLRRCTVMGRGLGAQGDVKALGPKPFEALRSHLWV